MREFIIITAIVIVVCFAAWSMWNIGVKGQKFYEQADILEHEIKTKDDLQSQFESLVALEQKSFHRNLSARVRELAKMMEVKYKVDLLTNP